jgi:uncharacterized membrane protein
MKIKKYDLILGGLILANIALCLYLALSSSNDLLCNPGSGCDTVKNSIYGTILGIKLAWFGVMSFSIFFILFLIARVRRDLYWMFFIATIAGALFAIYFIYLQAAVLKTFCRDCMIIDGIMLIMFVIVIFEYLDFKKEIVALEKSAENIIKA